MAESALADSRAAVRVERDIENNVVRMSSVSSEQGCRTSDWRLCPATGQVVQTHVMPDDPGYIVISTWRVPAHSHCSDDYMSRGVKGNAAAERNDAARNASWPTLATG